MWNYANYSTIIFNLFICTIILKFLRFDFKIYLNFSLWKSSKSTSLNIQNLIKTYVLFP